MENMVLACVFSPALNGRETRDKDGAYEMDEPSLVEANSVRTSTT